jgi:hypothetical protein
LFIYQAVVYEQRNLELHRFVIVRLDTKVALQSMRIAPIGPRLVFAKLAVHRVGIAIKYASSDYHDAIIAYGIADDVAKLVKLRFGYAQVVLFAEIDSCDQLIEKGGAFDSVHGLNWNKKRTLVKIVLSYIPAISLAGGMKRPLDLHEIIALALLAGGFVHGTLLGIFALL